jgi:CheY-like chemotaxis protein
VGAVTPRAVSTEAALALLSAGYDGFALCLYVGRSLAVAYRDKTILLAENDEAKRSLASAQLQRLGFVVDTVRSGKEAIAAFSRRRYELVFMNCSLPEMSGYEAAREWRRLEAFAGMRTPIIALTADAPRGDRVAYLAAGMDDYLPVPAVSRDLQICLERWLEHA